MENQIQSGATLPATPCYTIFYDMSSGGSEKESFSKLAVKLPEKEAREWFEKTYNRDPDNVTCECCGEDYAVYEKTHTDGADLVVENPSGCNEKADRSEPAKPSVNEGVSKL
mgnify:CR=1 FL=1